VEINVADTETARWKQKILHGIRAYSDKNESKGFAGATLRDIQRGPAQGLNSKELKVILESLMVAERIGSSEATAKNGSKVRYYYVAE
jgi:hypothetical protein